MSANLSRQRILLALALVLAWAPAAVIASPGAPRRAPVVAEAAAREVDAPAGQASPRAVEESVSRRLPRG